MMAVFLLLGRLYTTLIRAFLSGRRESEDP